MYAQELTNTFAGQKKSNLIISRCSSEAAVEEARLLLEQDMVKFCYVHKLDL